MVIRFLKRNNFFVGKTIRNNEKELFSTISKNIIPYNFKKYYFALLR